MDLPADLRLIRFATPAALVCALGLAGCSGTPAQAEAEAEAESGGQTESSESESGTSQLCEPGEVRCVDEGAVETCSDDGDAWEPTACAEDEACVDCEDGSCVAACVGVCDQAWGAAGCSFYTTGLYQGSLPPMAEPPRDAIVVTNPDLKRSATVQLFWISYGLTTEILDGNATLAPGESKVFELAPGLTDHEYPPEISLLRSGAMYHVVSDSPVVAHLHAPYGAVNSNESTLLLPERSLGQDYVILSHGAWVEPNYFVVIALEDDTTVTWEPRVETAGDDMPVPFVDAGGSGVMVLDRYDNLRVETSAATGRPKCEQDLSGTRVFADKPIWVMSAVRGLRLPWCGGSMVEGCDTIIDETCNFGSDFAIEQAVPPQLWGTLYVGAHSPVRGAETHYWRVYAGADNLTVSTNPPQPGTPAVLAAVGDWVDLAAPTGANLVFSADGPILPVQYISGHHDSANDMGSPAMVQAIPTDRFLDRYVFETGSGYEQHFAQAIRAVGGAEVTIDGSPVAGWEAIGAWEVANVEVSEGAHVVASDQPFGLAQYGYSQHIGPTDNSSGYAYVVGMRLD
ncbi:hypothetical protein ENSA5_32420 [Enhygromyxa salina]|uniref:IgGFc-binding protein N-terminal domain-containing protein n=1 Tax=Enhygromyxa salina TaxID=215803 RepID=A0A2S9XXF0_9BACT|nr:IgGFc-binding protein [Enhygromyxa salina]PRP97549.1 hypothetical protein ENSA5_32420 [Enhygromyxa salina]